MGQTITVECLLNGCEWKHVVEMERLTESLPIGMGKATISVYKGDDNADEFRLTICPEHTETLLKKFKPRKEASAGSGEELRAAAAAVEKKEG